MASSATGEPSKPATGLVVGVAFLLGPLIYCVGGLGGVFGERALGTPGYWLGCYVLAAVAAVFGGRLFARLFGGPAARWTCAALGWFVLGHTAWTALGGRRDGAELSASDAALSGLAALLGVACGLAVERAFAARTGPTANGSPAAN